MPPKGSSPDNGDQGTRIRVLLCAALALAVGFAVLMNSLAQQASYSSDVLPAIMSPDGSAAPDQIGAAERGRL